MLMVVPHLEMPTGESAVVTEEEQLFHRESAHPERFALRASCGDRALPKQDGGEGRDRKNALPPSSIGSTASPRSMQTTLPCALPSPALQVTTRTAEALKARVMRAP